MAFQCPDDLRNSPDLLNSFFDLFDPMNGPFRKLGPFREGHVWMGVIQKEDDYLCINNRLAPAATLRHDADSPGEKRRYGEITALIEVLLSGDAPGLHEALNTFKTNFKDKVPYFTVPTSEALWLPSTVSLYMVTDENGAARWVTVATVCAPPPPPPSP